MGSIEVLVIFLKSIINFSRVERYIISKSFYSINCSLTFLCFQLPCQYFVCFLSKLVVTLFWFSDGPLSLICVQSIIFQLFIYQKPVKIFSRSSLVGFLKLRDFRFKDIQFGTVVSLQPISIGSGQSPQIGFQCAPKNETVRRVCLSK